MIRFDERSGNLAVTELGRIASHYYIQNETIEHFNEKLKATISDATVCNIVAQAGTRGGLFVYFSMTSLFLIAFFFRVTQF
jgi:hypothetical protein